MTTNKTGVIRPAIPAGSIPVNEVKNLALLSVELGLDQCEEDGTPFSYRGDFEDIAYVLLEVLTPAAEHLPEGERYFKIDGVYEEPLPQGPISAEDREHRLVEQVRLVLELAEMGAISDSKDDQDLQHERIRQTSITGVRDYFIGLWGGI